MRSKPLLVTFALAALLTGCGSSPAAPRPTTNAPAKSTASAQSAPSGGDLTNNPFVTWIKRNHPEAAAQIIDDYLSTKVLGNYDPNVESQRDQLRRQALDTVTQELCKNVRPNLPTGLSASVMGSHVRVMGVTQQMGQDIRIDFDFDVRIDSAGIVWITTPFAAVHASSSSMLVKLLGGNLDQKAHDEIIRQLDIEGPKNAKTIKGLGYLKGGTFRLDPGEAFVNMPG